MTTRSEIAGFVIRRTTSRVAFRFLMGRQRRRTQTIVFFANANFITQCAHLRKTIAQCKEIILFNDGLALDVASFLRFGTYFPENLNGTDFVPAFLDRLDAKARVFLLGSQPHVVEAAAAALARRRQVDICGYIDGYSMWKDESELIQQLNRAAPDILLVALGNPLQEEWILKNRNKIQVPLVFSVGALFDFLSGYTARAPQAIRRCRMEWAYRLAREPARLLNRYTIGTVKFFRIVIFSRSDA